MSRAPGEVEAELAHWGVRIERKFLKMLSDTLIPDEHIEAAIWGLYATKYRIISTYRIGGFVVTRGDYIQHMYWQDVEKVNVNVKDRIIVFRGYKQYDYIHWECARAGFWNQFLLTEADFLALADRMQRRLWEQKTGTSTSNHSSVPSGVSATPARESTTTDFISQLERVVPLGTLPPTTEPAGTDFLSRLERLSRLWEQGHLSKDEFETAKKKLLNS